MGEFIKMVWRKRLIPGKPWCGLEEKGGGEVAWSGG